MAPTHARDDNYWRLVDPKASIMTFDSRLSEFGLVYHAPVRRDSVVRTLRHYEAGLCNYTRPSWTLAQLLKAATDRGIVKKDAAQLPRNRLVEILFSADAKRTFPRFTELPPELRVRVYEFHMARFASTPLSCPTDPPITRASRLLRTEALPVFYKTCSFRLNIETKSTKTGNPSMMRFDRATAGFLRACSSENIATMRKLHLAFSFGPSTKRGVYLLAIGKLEMSASGDSWQFVLGQSQYTSRTPLQARVPRELFERITREDVQGVMDQVVKRQGPLKLTLADLRALANSHVVSWESLQDA